MKNIPFFLAILLWGLASSCSEKTDFTLKGKIGNLPSDTLLVYYQIPQAKLDTLICQNGNFTYTIPLDTFTMFSLILDNQETLPVFAEKGKTVEIQGTADNLTIQGEGENSLMAQIMSLLKDLSPEEAQPKVDSLIQANPHSFTSLYLIDKYYVRNPEADYQNLEALTKNLYGTLKDTPQMYQLQPKIESLKNPEKNKSILSFQAFDTSGKDIKWNEIRDKYILLNLWASWSPSSMAERDSLKNLLKDLKKADKEDFVIYNLSLDMDKDLWLKACDEESEQWKHICDFKGWNGFVVRNQNIHELPYNLLLSPSKNIITRNISKDEVAGTLERHRQESGKTNKKRK